MTLEALKPAGFALDRVRLNIRMRVDGEHLCIGIEPSTGDRGTLHATLPIAFASGLDPDNAIDVHVAGLSSRRLTKASHDIAPLAPVLASTGNSDTALVDDEAGGKSPRLKARDKGEGEVALVIGAAALGEGLRMVGVESVVVGNIGGEAADPRTATGPPNNIGKLSSSWGQS